MRLLPSSYIFLILISVGCHSKTALIDKLSIQSTIHQRLLEQEKAWNTGDLEQFMQTYWNNPSLTFIGKSGPTYGWAQTLANYKRGYPDKDAMGRLSFEILETKVLSNNTAYVIGKYTLFREADQPSGYFSLLWQKMDGQWYIVSDHTSG